MSDEVLSADWLDRAIVALDHWAKIYHVRRPSVEQALHQAVQALGEVRVDLYGEPK